MPRRWSKRHEDFAARILARMSKKARPFRDMSPEAVERRKALPISEWRHLYLPHWFTVEDAPFHAEADARRNDLGIPLCECWAGGTGKTTCYVIADALYDICGETLVCKLADGSYLSRRSTDTPFETETASTRIIHIMLGAKAKATAAEKADLIRQELRHNPRLRCDYGDCIEPHLGTDQEEDYVANGLRFFCRGTGQSARGQVFNGKRIQKAIIDDAEDEVIGNKRERVDKLENWLLKDVFPRCEGAGQEAVFRYLANAYGRTCMSYRFMEMSKQTDEQGRPLASFHAYPLLDDNDESTWLARYSTNQIKRAMAIVGILRARREFLCLFTSDEATFLPEWFQTFDLRALTPEQLANLRVVAWHDTSWKATEKGDFKATVALGMFRDKPDVLCLAAWIRKAEGKEAARELCRIHGVYPRAVIWIEGNGGAEMAYKAFNELMVVEGREPGYWQYQDNTVAKNDRVGAWVGEASRGRWHFDLRQGNQRRLVDQFLDWPDGKRDGPDAFVGARDKLGTGSGGPLDVRHLARADRGALVGLSAPHNPPPMPGSVRETHDRWGESRFDRMARERNGLVF